MHSIRGKCLEATGDFSRAHESFGAMNRAARQTYNAAHAKDMALRYSELGSRDLPQFEFDESPPYIPVFMIGFPRSGTTLLETILDTHGDIRTLSEVDAITAVRSAMTRSGRSYPDDLPQLTADEVARLRAAYFDHNLAQADIDADAKFSVLVDKLPLNIIHIPLIKILFPDARFILSLRHPADVCLSCFQQDFVLNDEMLHFTSLESCFRRYRDIMSLFDTYRATLDLAICTIRYEDLVADFTGVVEGLFTYLGVEPDSRYRKFHEQNRDRLVTTPSKSQVIEPIYRSSRHRWTNYHDVIIPLLPIIAEQLELYGYTGDDRN